jgi:hypothetical protein
VTNASTQQITAAQASPRRFSPRPGSGPKAPVDRVYRPAGQAGAPKKKTGAAGKPWDKSAGKKKRRSPLLAARKKSPPKKLDAYSSHTGGSGWSNH